MRPTVHATNQIGRATKKQITPVMSSHVWSNRMPATTPTRARVPNSPPSPAATRHGLSSPPKATPVRRPLTPQAIHTLPPGTPMAMKTSAGCRRRLDWFAPSPGRGPWNRRLSNVKLLGLLVARKCRTERRRGWMPHLRRVEHGENEVRLGLKPYRVQCRTRCVAPRCHQQCCPGFQEFV